MQSSPRRRGSRCLIRRDSRLRGNDKWGKQAIREADARNTARVNGEVASVPPIAAHGKTRRELARDASHAIASALNLTVGQQAAELPA